MHSVHRLFHWEPLGPVNTGPPGLHTPSECPTLPFGPVVSSVAAGINSIFHICTTGPLSPILGSPPPPTAAGPTVTTPSNTVSSPAPISTPAQPPAQPTSTSFTSSSSANSITDTATTTLIISTTSTSTEGVTTSVSQSTPLQSNSLASPTVYAAAPSTKSYIKTIPIIVGVVVPIVLIILGAAAFFLYKRCRRARDRREWERTHAEIEAAVRHVGAPASVPAWSAGPRVGDVKNNDLERDGDTDLLFDKASSAGFSHRSPPRFLP